MIDFVAELLAFNLSFYTGVFPTDIKLAKVIPTFKDGDFNILCNYRPISSLISSAKILEMYNRMFSFINNHSLLSQS